MKLVATQDAPAAIGPYSQAVDAGDLVFVSGQLGLDPATGELEPDVASQADRALDNLRAILGAAGLPLSSVVKTTVFLQEMADFAAVNERYGAAFGEHRPARSTVAVRALPKGGLVEIEAIARRP